MKLSLEHLPEPKQEAWKYTNLRKALPEGLTLAPDEEEIVIHRNSGQNGGKAQEILFTGRSGLFHSPRLKIVLEEGAEATLIEHHNGQGAYWKNMEVEISLTPGSRLNHYRVLEGSAEGVITITTRIRQERDSFYDGFYIVQNGGLTRNEIVIEMVGKGAKCSFSGLNLLKDREHGDTTIVVEHKAPHCSSSQFFRSVLDDNARGVFQGKIHVHKEAQKSDGYQLSNAILLSEGAEMDTKPELEIYADDVKCSHGATTGQLDEEPLFYLRSRGLSKRQARMLLIQSFVDETAEKIMDDGFKLFVKERAQEWLRIVI